MQIYTRVDAFVPAAAKPLVLGLGNFDGLHLGHQAILKRAVEKAKQSGGVPAVFTFYDHPQGILHPEGRPKLITSVEQKLVRLEALGIGVCFLIPFTKEFSQLKARRFVELVLVRQLRVAGVLLGHDARFGNGREGDPALMRQLASEFGFSFEMAEPVTSAGETVSSSRIRKLIASGLLEEAQACLGRPFSIMGKIVAGSGRGKSLGFPTANLAVSGCLMPPEAVYPVRVRTLELDPGCTAAEPPRGFPGPVLRQAGPWKDAVMNFGKRPTFEDARHALPVAEIFVFDSSEDYRDRTLEILIYPKIRDERCFSSGEALKSQIRADVEEAKVRLHSQPAPEGPFEK